MKIRITFEVDDLCREAINWSMGRKGKATYDETRSEMISLLQSDLEVITGDYELAKEDDEVQP
jgi:hypothetical protein